MIPARRWRLSSAEIERIPRSVVAVDCGLAVNPLNVEGQIQGGVINALSTVLKEEVRFANGGVKSSNFEDYEVLRMSEVPDIEEVLREAGIDEQTIFYGLDDIETGFMLD
jgi:CO/xanthine dehydrogenase Mo-binding subunit